MDLKIKFLKWATEVPTAMIDKETAEKIGIHSKDRISIRTLTKYPREMSMLVDSVEGIVGKNEIAVSENISSHIHLKEGQRVDVNIAVVPKSTLFIKNKLDGKRLSDKEIREIVRDITNNYLSQAEIALFISSMYTKGMNFKETISLTKAILESGDIFKLRKKFVADKHSIGGVPGNRTTPIVVSICAVAGLTMPKTSSRAITSAAGTADVIETVARVEFTVDEVKKIISKTNACMIWGGMLGMVPADSKIIDTEKTLKIDPEAQLLASIMSKKLSVGSEYILIDIPYGAHAKVGKTKAMRLKRRFEKLGKYFKRDLKVVLTNGEQPVGNGIGPALELMDILNILNPRKKGPQDLERKSLFLAGELLEMTGKAKEGKGADMAKEILCSGKALDKFKQIIKAQGGNLGRLRYAKFKQDILATSTGEITEIHNKKITALARLAGCPVDKSSGIYLYFHKGHRVKKGGKIATIYADSLTRLHSAVNFFHTKKPIKIK